MTVVVLVFVIATVNPVIIYSQNIINENSDISKSNDDMPIKNKIVSRLVKTAIVLSSFTIIEIIMSILLLSTYAFSLNAFGAFGSDMSMTQSSATMAFCFLSLLVIVPSFSFLGISYKRLISTIENLKIIYSKEFK
jgi:hypothetical protein